MAYSVERFDAHPWSDAQLEQLFADAFPPFISADPVAAMYRDRVHDWSMVGTVAEWETWTGMALPSTGEYVIPDGLATLHVDRETDMGTYVEPNVWVRHR